MGNLFTLGWAGLLTYDEALKIQGKIVRDIRVRRVWKFRGRGKPPLVRIAERAFPENPQVARQNILREMRQNRTSRQKQRFRIAKRKGET